MGAQSTSNGLTLEGQKNGSNYKRQSSDTPGANSKKRRRLVRGPWILPEDDILRQSPSQKESKITLAQELRLKESIHDFVVKLGLKLKVDAPTILATSVYLHRYYQTVQITSSKYYVASAALYISGKINDCVNSYDRISLYACNLKNPQAAKCPAGRQPPPIDEQSEYYGRWKSQVTYREEMILHKLNFDLNFASPYLLQHKILNRIHSGMRSTFYEKRKDIMSRTIKLIELLSSLPVILCYDMKVIFVVCFVITVLEGSNKFKDLTIPENFTSISMEVPVAEAAKCFNLIKKLLEVAQSDTRCISNKAAAKRLLGISSEKFLEVAKGKP
ncbi:uncharacterized protein LODBEIA_P53310 [Lodderomyces beijingensis]|uniref:Cyclin N-terminal domain-containing protein n=1 Tax=Lodderomyces beijingensis TaxID=1775926 RepID=A0ABP0ZUT6_9ASCO